MRVHLRPVKDHVRRELPVTHVGREAILALPDE